ncbi:Suppressor of forked [Trypanosoma melophagium]|uniref:Suppressor of forked n=1 Tax=Trypanosoma melophagium TaxID=715481 RepID=UPI00351A0061|nr:Suppressor of forked [Trypanosoma melophagium]
MRTCIGDGDEDDCQLPLLLGDYIKSNPSSALSARWVYDLPDEEQGSCIVKMIEEAVYQETWISYFDYAEKKGIVITDEVALEAIHSVGLDPFSAPLWLRVIRLISEEEKKRELFQLALRIPLYQQNLVYKDYRNFELEVANQKGHTTPNFIPLSEVVQFSEILKTEPTWPDRFVDVRMIKASRKDALCAQWNNLLRSMMDYSVECSISQDLKLRRIELAFRQLCTQFAQEDVCWYAYASFVAVHLKDEIQARDILEKGLSCIGNHSIALRSLEALLSKPEFGLNTVSKQIVKDGIFEQRLYANAAKDSLQNRKRFRDVGKNAAANSVRDWRIYQQWASAEQCITQDFQMASKVYERGVSCVIKSLKDAVLLSDKAIKYHLWRHDEREALGYAERQLELLSSSLHDGLVRASWNNLVNVESLLGLPSLPKTLKRRTERYNELPHISIINRYRVGNYLPCSDEDIDWLEFVDDFTKARKEEQEPIFESHAPLKNASISGGCVKSINTHVSQPEIPLWSALEVASNREHSSSIQDADEVVGPRTFRGRLVYKLQIDDKTDARIKREERIRKEMEGNEEHDKTLGSAHNALNVLVEKISARKWNPTQLRICRNLSVDWLMNTLTMGELDLVKKRR